MYQHHIAHRPSQGEFEDHLLKPVDSLGIGNTNFIWNRKGKQLVIIMETKSLVGRDLSVTLKNNRLILEAPILSSYNKPFRMHLIEQDIRNQLEEDLTIMAKSEVKLNHGYQYHLVSYKVIDSKLVKVILGFTVNGRNRNN